MKKPLKALFAALLPVTLVLSAFFAACADEHEHTLESVPAVAATCTQDGNIAYWHCADCNKYFEDEEASKEITLADTVTAKLGHDFETAWLSDEAGHWHKCSRCDATDTKAAHADADEDGKCDACGHAVQQGEEPADYKLTINGAEVKLDGNTEANGGPYKTTIGENNTLNVTYTVGGQSYQNVGLTAIESVMKANDTFSATVKNNGAAAVRFRVNIFYWVSDSDNGSVNISATQDGAPVYTDTVNGGSFFDIAVGATVKIEVRYDNTKALSSVQFMIDSSCDTADERSGDVTISGMVFSLAPVAVTGVSLNKTETVIEQGKTETLTATVAPSNAANKAVTWKSSDEEVATVSDTGVVTAVAPGKVTITAITEDGNKTATCTIKVTPVITEIDLEAEGVTVVSADVYTTTVTDGKLNVKYNNLVGNYENVQINGITEEIQANNVFTAKITNSGTSTANVRINIFANKVGNSEASNLSATQDGVPVRTDTTWGGSFFTVDAGKTIEIVVIYDTERTSTAVQFMIDSHMGDSTARSGDITISGCGLYKNADYVPPEEGEEPVAPPVDEDAVELTFESTEVFTVDKNGVAATAVNVTYTAAKGGKYANIASRDAATYAAGNDTFTVTITNNSDVAKNVRIDVIGEKSVKPEGNPDGTNVCNLSHEIISGTVVAADGSNYTDTTWGGTTITVGGRSSVTVAIKYEGGNPEKWGDVLRVQFYFETSKSGDTNTYSGNFTISNFKFTSSAGTAEEGRFAAVKNRVSFSGNNGFKVANGYANNDDMFNCVWNSANVAVADDGVMSMSVTKDGASARGYYGGEYRSEATYGYGYYEVCMKPAKCSGVVSSFFTYTNSPVWDEIDIEFLGKDTTKVQFNYYVNGVGGHEHMHDLGFDASADFHVYGFDWQEGSITWYVDGKDVYTATPPEQGEAFPSHNQQIMMNVWNCTGHDDWTGPLAEDSLPATAQYKWVAYEANA